MSDGRWPLNQTSKVERMQLSDLTPCIVSQTILAPYKMADRNESDSFRKAEADGQYKRQDSAFRQEV